MSLWSKHAIFEKNSIILVIGILVVIAIGGLVEIVPLFYLKSTIEKVDGVRPYTPLELAGRNIYVREGCYNCHSQMIRPLRDEVERYGHYSLAAESMYDQPFQWGSSAPARTSRASAASIPTTGIAIICATPRSVVPGIDHAGLSVARARPSSITRTSPTTCRSRRRSACPTRAEMIANAKADVRDAGDRPTRPTPTRSPSAIRRRRRATSTATRTASPRPTR